MFLQYSFICQVRSKFYDSRLNYYIWNDRHFFPKVNLTLQHFQQITVLIFNFFNNCSCIFALFYMSRSVNILINLFTTRLRWSREADLILSVPDIFCLFWSVWLHVSQDYLILQFLFNFLNSRNLSTIQRKYPIRRLHLRFDFNISFFFQIWTVSTPWWHRNQWSFDFLCSTYFLRRLSSILHSLLVQLQFVGNTL